MLYERLIERALEMGAWVGPLSEVYDALPDREETESSDELETSETSEPSKPSETPTGSRIASESSE
jgi:hypothetical protein